ncbi:zinc-finger homeodomain protein 3 [Pyrus ussuriensis x Pyrus communis]|uniref:Zinc-finger homeodomain protein 3 n=1 Tax=Pyrus ussuriensis x Pyrus communis TaxID=2448454 RepID=A0A5N5FSD8_9ROSA|nr:zinc-finger homeodomain protein 3 [Pyrus ussuriensis x Pyrus communis]KAB2619934.1 zinc-finger homeodomain protein 3 [Pyrus ussuriensis x Pyrus communis]
MVVVNSCPMEKRAPSKPSRALTALPATTTETSTEKKLKVNSSSIIFPLGIIISIIPSIGRLELGV